MYIKLFVESYQTLESIGEFQNYIMFLLKGIPILPWRLHTVWNSNNAESVNLLE